MGEEFRSNLLMISAMLMPLRSGRGEGGLCKKLPSPVWSPSKFGCTMSYRDGICYRYPKFRCGDDPPGPFKKKMK